MIKESARFVFFRRESVLTCCALYILPETSGINYFPFLIGRGGRVDYGSFSREINNLQEPDPVSSALNLI